MTIKRRDAVRALLIGGGGAAAALQAMNAVGLMALALETPAAVPDAWHWDGDFSTYLRRLDDLIQRGLQRQSVQLRPWRPGAAEWPVTQVQLHVAYELPERWRLDPTRPPDDYHTVPLTEGAVAKFTLNDPIRNLETNAAQFVEAIVRTAATHYIELPLPAEVLMGLRRGVCRLVADYDIRMDAVLMRVDLALARLT